VAAAEVARPGLTAGRPPSVAGQWWLSSEGPLLGALGLTLLIVLWEVVGRLIEDPTFVSRPSLVWAAGLRQWASGQLPSDIAVSLRELAAGFGLAFVVGVPAGLVMGCYRQVEYAFDPFLWFFYSAPVIAFYPLLIMWLGLGSPTIIALTFLFSVFSVVANTVTGVQQVEPVLVRAARAFGGTETQTMLLVVLPAAVPAITAGVRLGIGRALIGTIVGEFFGANAGLGFRIHLYGTEIRSTEMLVPVSVVMFIGAGLIQSVRWVEDRLSTWRA
jgi:NitT/TauT family transport system permease protein